MQDPTTQQPAWYKTRSGKIFLTILTLIVLALLGFASLIGYYTWQISQGNDVTPINPQQGQISKIAGIAEPADTDVDMASIIHPHNPSQGPEDAAVTIIAFIDFECPFCRRSYPVTKGVFEQFSGAIRVVFKHMPIEGIHENARPAAIAAQCAYEQNAFWAYHDKLFTEQRLTDDAYIEYARELTLDMPDFTDCLDAETVAAQVTQDFQDGAKLGVAGTPTYFINGKKLSGSQPHELWSQLILSELQAS